MVARGRLVSVSPGRDTISGQTKRCSTPNYMPSTEQSCGLENSANTTKNTPFVDLQAAMKRCLTDHQGQ